MPAFRNSDGRFVLQAAKEMARICHSGRSGIRNGRRTSLAARLVWRKRIFSLARIEGLQDARPRAAFALSGLHAMSRLQRAKVSAGSAAFSSPKLRSEENTSATHSRVTIT